MRLHVYFIIFVAIAKDVGSDPGLSGGLSNQLLFDEDQALLPSDLTESAENQQSSAIANELWPLSSDNSIPFTSENIVSIPNDFFASDPFASADCSTSDNLIFPNISKSRLKRIAQCDSFYNNGSPPTLTFPNGHELDENLRGTILRENPGLYDTLRLSQDKEEDNTACIIITVGILPVGVCSSATIHDWNFRASRTFSWNWMSVVTLWDLSHVTPGMLIL